MLSVAAGAVLIERSPLRRFVIEFASGIRLEFGAQKVCALSRQAVKLTG
jgi:hypothetical protein